MRPATVTRRLLRGQPGFTLVELLVVILIIAVLVAISAPSFLGQTQKAHDSVAQQYLTVAYHAAAADATQRDGDFVDSGYTADQLADAIHSSEPYLTVVTDSCPADASTDPKYIVIDTNPLDTNADDLEMCNDPSHTVWILTVRNHGLLSITSIEVTGGVVAAPVNNTPPAISDTPQIGLSLSASTGAWANSPTGYAYQWQRSANSSTWSNVPAGGISSSYTVASGDLSDYLRVVVTATNDGGSASASSSATAQVLPAAPVNTAAPVVSGTAQVGSSLSTTTGTWTNSPTGYAYQWQDRKSVV